MPEDLKNIVDCHVHSNFSLDSMVPPETIVQEAKKKGLAGITITDHIDFDYPHRPEEACFDPHERFLRLSKLQKTFPDIKILQGLELGIQPHVIEKSSAFVQENFFDLVINSTHVVDSVDVCRRHLNESWTKEEVYHRYLLAVYDSVRLFDDFDIVGHIGFITRYVSYADPSLKYSDHADILDTILTTLIHKGKGIEVNTAGYSYKLNTPHPSYDILKRYKELGGTVLTLGSDAHTLGQIGDHFSLVLQKLTAIGFKYVCYFEKRKPVFSKI